MNRPMLLIDDDKTFLETLARSLQRRGENVLAASNTEDALHMLQKFNPDRAVLDMNLAGESGLQLLTKMLEISPQLRIIVLTGYASIVTAVDAMKQWKFKPATLNGKPVTVYYNLTVNFKLQ